MRQERGQAPLVDGDLSDIAGNLFAWITCRSAGVTCSPVAPGAQGCDSLCDLVETKDPIEYVGCVQCFAICRKKSAVFRRRNVPGMCLKRFNCPNYAN